MKRTTVSERALVLAPRGRDAAIATAMLGEAKILAEPCASLPDLLRLLDQGAGFVIVTEEALATADLTPLAAWLADQQAWSDMPFVLLTSQGGGLERNPAAQRYLDVLGNVTFLERPFHPTTLVSLARSALRARRRQYEARARLEVLRESQERYRTLFETIDEGFCVIEFIDGPHGPLSDYVHIEANPAYTANAGIPDIVGKRLRELVGDEADGWAEIYRQVLLTGRSIRFERELEATGRTLELAAFRVEPESRRQVAVLFQDITDRKRAEERLRESEAYNAALLSQAAAGIASTDGLGRFTYVNDRYCAIVGRPREELLGTSMQALTHPDDHGSNLPLFREAVEGGPAFEIEKRYLRPDGSTVWVRNSVTAIRDASGAFQSILAVSVDISDRKAAEEALRKTEAALRKLNETLELRVEERTTELNRLWTLSEDMLARADYSGMMSAVSPAWTRVLGWSEAELLSRPYSTFMHPEDIVPTLASLAHMGETTASTRYENRIATRDGGWKPIEWTVVPEPDGGNFIAVGRDLSAVRAREAELEQAQDALRQAQKMEAMGQLTGGVAHDFNNLLTPIIGSLDRLITRGVGSGREQVLMAGALESAERAKTLVQRLLAFARRQPLQATGVDLASLVHGMAGLIGSTLSPRIDVKVEIEPDLPPARADANQLEMALLNLAVNARDAMPNGGSLSIVATRKSVRGRHRSGLPLGHYVRLSVTDTGMGMDKATLARAIEPFFSTKGIGKGTGLGLSMVHGLAAQLGGGLTIRSEPGQGTTVELWLPISAEPVEEAGAVRPVPASHGVRGRVLLVDDEDLVRMSTADMLGDLGFEVIEAGSAEEALRHVEDGMDLDLLVTDHLMPGMSGADLARRVQPLRPGLPVLIVSGYAEVEGIASDLPRLVKPFRARELAEQIAAIVSTAEASD